MMYPRQKRQWAFAALLAVIAVANVLFFVILHQPARSEYADLDQKGVRLRTEKEAADKAIERLMKISEQLVNSDADRTALLTGHFVPRSDGYSKLLPVLDQMTRRTGVVKTRVNFSQEKVPQYGLETVTIKLPVQGLYPNIVSFIKELEDSDTFFILDSIDVRTDAESSPGGKGIALNLGLETYFYQ